MIARWTPRRNPSPRQSREEMIAQTNAFLTWALAEERHLPRIPRRRVDQGGFTGLLDRPMAKTVVHHWWGWVLQRIDR